LGPARAEPLPPQAVLAVLLQLRPGQKLIDFDAPSPGAVLVVRGQLWLLARDERGEPFTLERLGPGRTAGIVPLLRGLNPLALAAAELSQVWLLPAEALLNWVSNQLAEYGERQQIAHDATVACIAVDSHLEGPISMHRRDAISARSNGDRGGNPRLRRCRFYSPGSWRS